MSKRLIKGIEEILEETFKEIDGIYLNQCEGKKPFQPNANSRLIFPRKGWGIYKGEEHKENENEEVEIRVSEQELRFVFVEKFIKRCGDDFPYYFAVETPTDKRYVFSTGDETPRLAVRGIPNSKGQQEGTSGNFDITIHDNTGKRVCWIEFKAGMPDQEEFSKDFLKLKEEAGGMGYFVHLLKAADRGTLKSLLINDGLKYKKPKLKERGNIIYYCHILPPRDKENNENKYQKLYYTEEELKRVLDSD